MSVMQTTSDHCAHAVIDTIPLVMRHIRAEVRQLGIESLSVPQLRVLAYLSTAPGGSLSDVADHIGVTKATASVLVERLVRRQLIDRSDDPEERRKMVLVLTEEGERICTLARKKAEVSVSAILNELPAAELHILEKGLELLRQAFMQANQALTKSGEEKHNEKSKAKRRSGNGK